MSNEYRVYISGHGHRLESKLNDDAKDGFSLWKMFPTYSKGEVLLVTVKWGIDQSTWDMLTRAAEAAYKSEVIDTQSEEHMIGPDNEYADKEDWMDSWMEGLKE